MDAIAGDVSSHNHVDEDDDDKYQKSAGFERFDNNKLQNKAD